MKEFTKNHGHKFLLPSLLIWAVIIAGSLLFWGKQPMIVKSMGGGPTATINLSSSTVASPKTMMVTNGSTVVWKNNTSSTVKLVLTSMSGQGSTLKPGSSYSLALTQAGTVDYTFGDSESAKGSLIVQP